jgi:hypothetical protein
VHDLVRCGSNAISLTECVAFGTACLRVFNSRRIAPLGSPGGPLGDVLASVGDVQINPAITAATTEAATRSVPAQTLEVAMIVQDASSTAVLELAEPASLDA